MFTHSIILVSERLGIFLLQRPDINFMLQFQSFTTLINLIRWLVQILQYSFTLKLRDQHKIGLTLKTSG